MNDIRVFQRAKDYLWGLHRYFQTEKGRHDLLDYLRAAFIISTIITVALILLKWII